MWYLDATIADNTTTTYVDNVPDSALTTVESASTLPNYSSMFGSYAQAYKSNQAILFSAVAPAKELWINGLYGTNPYSATISGEGGQGVNVAGASLTFQGGPGTGSAAGGGVNFNYCPAGSSGSAWNSCVGVGGIGPNGLTANYTNSGAASVPLYVTNASSTSGGSVELRLAARGASGGFSARLTT